jgi:hypothetical protein
MGERPALMASTFQPEVGEARCTTMTPAGDGAPSVTRAWASSAAMGMPTMPGPMTPIFRTSQRASAPSSDSGIRLRPRAGRR